MFGPGQTVTAVRFLRKLSSYLCAAGLLNPTHKHSLSNTGCNSFSYCFAGKFNDCNWFIFSFWYFDDAVQIGSSVNSVLLTKCFSVQGLPGIPLSILFCFSRSELVPFK